jgi:hypothetical protein
MAESGSVLNVISNMNDITGSIKSISHVHSEIHDGDFYRAILNTTNLGASSWIMLQINTPSSTATSTQASIVYFYYEGSTGTNQGKNAAYGRDENEWILKGNSTYVYKITNLGSAGLATLRLNWYEV